MCVFWDCLVCVLGLGWSAEGEIEGGTDWLTCVHLSHTHSTTKTHRKQALAYVLLWQYALCIPVLILSVTLFLAIIQSVRRALFWAWIGYYGIDRNRWSAWN